MSTFTATKQVQIEVQSQAQNKDVNAFWENAEFNRFGIVSMLLIFIPCMGAIAMSFGAFEYLPKLISTVASSMAVLISILALLPMRAIFAFSAIALAIDLFFLVGLLF